jgi:hypothetical protein
MKRRIPLMRNVALRTTLELQYGYQSCIIINVIIIFIVYFYEENIWTKEGEVTRD